MGAVLKGRDPDFGRDLAVKVLLESHEDKPEMLRRFVLGMRTLPLFRNANDMQIVARCFAPESDGQTSPVIPTNAARAVVRHAGRIDSQIEFRLHCPTSKRSAT